MTRLIAYGFVLVALVLFMECTAKDYNERIGPYEVNFTLPNDIVSNTEVNKTITNGPLFDLYVIELQIPGNKYKRDVDHFRGLIVTAHSNETSDSDLNITEIMKNFDKEGMGRMYHDCTSVPQIINDQYWIIVYCSGGDRISDYCAFGYQPNNRTAIFGLIYPYSIPDVLPFLKSLHVREVA